MLLLPLAIAAEENCKDEGGSVGRDDDIVEFGEEEEACSRAASGPKGGTSTFSMRERGAKRSRLRVDLNSRDCAC